MKLLDLSHIIAGVRKLGAVKDTFLHLQESFSELSDALARSLFNNNQTDPIVMWGCVNSGTGLNYIISAGAIYYQGEIYQVPAFTGTATGLNVPTLSINTTYRSVDPVVYSDTNTFNTHAVRQMAWTITASGGGLVDFGAAKRSNRGGGNNAWNALPLNTGWAAFINPDTNPFFRYTFNGMVELKGAVKQNSGTFQLCVAGTLPAPAANNPKYFAVPYTAHGGGAYLGYCHITVQDDGSVFVDKAPVWVTPSAIDVAVDLSGVRYWPANY
jgi:hypothetical protein